jgi:hypothetical protein
MFLTIFIDEIKQLRDKIARIESQADDKSSQNDFAGSQNLKRNYSRSNMMSNPSTEEQVLSPAPNRAKLLSDNHTVMNSARTENYRAPKLRALDNKLKNIISEKKKVFGDRLKKTISETRNEPSVREDDEHEQVEDLMTSHLTNENNFLKKKMKEMQRVISELNQSKVKNSHLENLKREIESKNHMIHHLESKMLNSREMEQTISPKSEKREKLKNVIQEEMKLLKKQMNGLDLPNIQVEILGSERTNENC